MDCSTRGSSVLHYLPEFDQIHVTESVMLSNHLILCGPLLLLPSIFPSIRDFSNESVLRIRWPKYWSFSLSINPSNEYSELISFRTDWFDLVAVQGTLKSLLKHHSSKHQFFSAQLSLWSNSHIHIWMTTGKTIPLTTWIFVSKVMSLLFNMLFRFVVTSLPKSKHLLISQLQPLSRMILESRNIGSVAISTVARFICHEVMGPDAILVFWIVSFKPVFSLSSFFLIKRLF